MYEDTDTRMSGIVSLVCIKGFVLLSATQGFGSRAELLACQLEWEYYWLARWANAVSLLNDPPQVNVYSPLLVGKTVRTLEQLLTNTDRLKQD